MRRVAEANVCERSVEHREVRETSLRSDLRRTSDGEE